MLGQQCSRCLSFGSIAIPPGVGAVQGIVVPECTRCRPCFRCGSSSANTAPPSAGTEACRACASSCTLLFFEPLRIQLQEAGEDFVPDVVRASAAVRANSSARGSRWRFSSSMSRGAASSSLRCTTSFGAEPPLPSDSSSSESVRTSASRAYARNGSRRSAGSIHRAATGTNSFSLWLASRIGLDSWEKTSNEQVPQRSTAVEFDKLGT